MNWTDAEDIGIALFEKYPDTDPLSLRFTDLCQMIVELDEFDDDPKASSEGKLENIQMAWYDEVSER